MNKFLSITSLFFIFQISFGQSFQDEFYKYYHQRDTTNQLKTLQKWEKTTPNDAELFTSYFNYYMTKAEKEVLALTTTQPKSGEGFILKDSTNQTAGFLGSQTYYDANDFDNGIKKIDEGIKLHPNRLDMRFGKIYMLGQNQDWNAFTDEIIVAVKYSGINKNEWTWTNNVKKKEGQNFFLGAIQDYQLNLYETGNDNLLLNMRKIANEILLIYPNHIESLSNLSITYLLNEEYDKALEPLLKAEKLNPKDYIVLSNIAQCYKMKENKKSAIEYYKKVSKFGNDETKQYAKEQIDELKN